MAETPPQPDEHAAAIAAVRRLWDKGLASGPSEFADWEDLRQEAHRRFAARRTPLFDQTGE